MRSRGTLTHLILYFLSQEVQQLSWVGHGGYGAVYKGVWQGATVAAKYTVADQVDLQGARAHEAVLSKILSHPNVVQTFASRVAILTEDFLKATFNGDAMYASQTYNSDSGFKSGDGFGNPYGNTTTSIRFADVLTHVGAKPGSVMTQVRSSLCLGILVSRGFGLMCDTLGSFWAHSRQT